MSDSRLERQLGVRLSDDDFARLNALADRLGQKQHAAARAALRLGMTELEAHPERFVSDDAREKAPTKKRSK